jgi:uncharacterized protein with PQ loop repeat
MELLTLIGLAATAVSASRSIPQLARTIRTRDTSGLTPATAGCTAISAAGWGLYGLSSGDATLLATSGVTALGAATLAVLVGRLGGMPQWSKRIMVLWAVLLLIVASIGGPTALAAALTVAVLVNATPQVRAVLADPTASGVSVTGWAIAAVEGLLWGCYGVAGGNASLAVWGLFAILPAVTVLSIVLPRRISARSRVAAVPSPAPVAEDLSVGELLVGELLGRELLGRELLGRELLGGEPSVGELLVGAAADAEPLVVAGPVG